MNTYNSTLEVASEGVFRSYTYDIYNIYVYISHYDIRLCTPKNTREPSLCAPKKHIGEHKSFLVFFWCAYEFSCVFLVDVRVLLCFFCVPRSSPVFFPKRQKNKRELLVFWSAQTRFFGSVVFL